MENCSHTTVAGFSEKFENYFDSEFQNRNQPSFIAVVFSFSTAIFYTDCSWVHAVRKEKKTKGKTKTVEKATCESFEWYQILLLFQLQVCFWLRAAFENHPHDPELES